MYGPLVSVIINNYNYGRFLSRAINSVLNQSYSDIEVIVVDDGSADNSREIISSYGNRIIPLLKENGGQSSAFNTGFRVSRGEVICLLDSDDVFINSKVQEVVDYFSENDDIVWLFHQLKYIDSLDEFLEKESTVQETTKLIDLRKKIIFNGKMPFIAAATSGLCFRRKLLEQILPMPEFIKITSDNYIKFASLILSPGLYLNKALAYQRIHGENAYTGKNDLVSRGYIHCQIAYYLMLNIKGSDKFAFKLMASALSDLLRAGSRNALPGEAEKYLSSVSAVDKLRLYARCILKALQHVIRDLFWGIKS